MRSVTAGLCLNWREAEKWRVCLRCPWTQDAHIWLTPGISGKNGKGGGRKADVASGVERRRLDLSKREGGESGPLSLRSVPLDHSRHEQEQDRRGAAGETVRPAEGAQAWRAELLDLLLPSSLTSPESAASSQRTSRMKQK